MARSAEVRSSGSGTVGGVDAGRLAGGSIWIMAVSGLSPSASVEFHSYWSFAELWNDATAGRLLAVAVDMPLGLPSATDEWRKCETRARELLGRAREKAVFRSPPLCALSARDHDKADRLAAEAGGRELSGESYRLLPKCRDVRDALTPEAFRLSAWPQVAEVHAETCFWGLNNREPTRFGKREMAGQEERLALLRPQFSNIDTALAEAADRPDSALDRYDLLDAAAAAWTARRIASRTAEDLRGGEYDDDGFPMSIWV